MKLFNAIQLNLALVLGPILIPLLKSCSFYGAVPVMYILSFAWLALFGWTTAMIWDCIDSGN